jgi:colanic acid biosynthesis glycosyl transferase WcaI
VNQERLRIAVLCPHFAPDTAPTGDVMTRIVSELAALGHEVHVVTALPWYRSHAVEPGWEARWEARWMRRETTPWGSITRVNPFPGSDKRNLARRAAGFVAFSGLAGLASLRGGRVDAVIAMSPPLTMGLTGWTTHVKRRGPLIFNIQDVFPDAAVATGAITNKWIIALASWLERASYRRAAAVTVLSTDLRDNVAAKVRPAKRADIRVIPNFVDTDVIRPLDRMTSLRRELGIGDETVALYAGNVGFSQSLEMVIEAAKAMPFVTFLINGDGAARASLHDLADGVANIRFSGYQPASRLAEVLATGDIHLVPLKAGLGRVSVPSKTYSILAAGRPALAAIDQGTEVPRILAASGGGVSVPPDDGDAFQAALQRLVADEAGRHEMAVSGRRWVEQAASPRAVAMAYAQLVVELNDRR